MLPTTCPFCSRRYRVDAAPGEAVRCPGCRKFSALAVDAFQLAREDAADTRRTVRRSAAVLVLALFAGPIVRAAVVVAFLAALVALALLM